MEGRWASAETTGQWPDIAHRSQPDTICTQQELNIRYPGGGLCEGPMPSETCSGGGVSASPQAPHVAGHPGADVSGSEPPAAGPATSASG